MSNLTLILFAFCTITNLYAQVKPNTKYIPEIAGEWKTLYKPEITGSYINDHTVYKHTDGTWHVIGITSFFEEQQWENEFYFTHGKADSLFPQEGFKEMPKICEHGELAWAPHAISHYDTCFLFYSPLEIKLEISVDMQIWENWDDSIHHPLYTLKFRDPMILKIEDNTWIMYATALRHLNGNNSYGGVAKYISNDLRTWEFSGYALEMIDDAKSPEWSNVESPFVTKYGDYYYLLLTFTDSDISTYHKTLVFRSDNPYDFGKYDGHKIANTQCDLVTGIGAHAPEFVYDDMSDKWYITTCGWNEKDKPKAAQGGVGIAEIVWKEENTVLVNHDFEYGDLTGWEIIFGSAFSVSYSQKNENNVYFDQNGIFYLSGNPSQRGEIRSQSFIIDIHEINFMVSGASDENNLFIALISSENNEVLFKETGNDSIVFSRKTWNVSDYIGEECYIKIVDNSSSSSFNIDDINIIALKPDDIKADESRKP